MSTAAAPKPVLPTLERLGVAAPTDVDASKIAGAWLAALAQFVSAQDVDGILSLFAAEGWWRDAFALTWDLRTFHGASKIAQFLRDRLDETKPTAFTLGSAEYQQPFPDLAWISADFTFQTAVANASGIVRLVPSASGPWKAFLVFTNLEALIDHPEKIGPLRSFKPNHGKWLKQREREREFAEGDPQVLIVGGGQSGLDVAARLKHLDIPTLVVEKNERIGDMWRKRYEALCLHDPVWYDHMPYIPFPESWPVYTPAQKLADWFEFYADAMELNVWTSSTVTHAKRDDASGKWVVTVRRKDGSERVFRVDHVVFALGLGGGTPNIPDIPGKEEFQGQVLHSTQHGSARDHVGKKVFIVGACTSAHDIAADYAENGVDVTIFQRSSTYIMTTKEGMPRLMSPFYWEGGPTTEVADRLSNSFPIYFNKLIAQRVAAGIHEADKALHDDLRKVGYKLNYGDEGSGFLFLALKRAGGYYLDVGACQMIVDGKIKLKNDSPIARFTKTGLAFEDGSEVEADVVLFATGFSDARTPIRDICGDAVGDKIPPIWGLNDEGELRGVWRELGVPNLWYMMGNLAWCRFFSKHVALQIKAKQEGIFGTRYSAPVVWD